MSEKIDNLLTLAKRAKENGDNSSAARYYQQVLIEDPNNWEAMFYYDFCTAATCVIANIGSSATRLANSFRTVFNSIRNANLERTYKRLYLVSFASDALQLLGVMRNSAYAHYLRYSEATDAHYEYYCRAQSCGEAAKAFGDCFYAFSDRQMAATCYEIAYTLSDEKIVLSEQETACIREYNPQFKVKTQTNGCYVATAVYGSYDCPQVWTLRRYRDNILAQNWFGRAFIRTYYAISPTLVKWFGETNWFKNMWRGKLDRMVKKLQENGVEDTPYEDRNW